MTLFRCRRCLYPSTKPDLWFDDTGLCSACTAFDRRKSIDWTAKQAEFVDLIRENPGRTHDCIVAVSGGKDSTWQVVKCLELGMRPLAVCATTDHLTPLGRRNLDNIAELCDLVEVTPHKPTRRKISRFALDEVGDISWCEHHLIWSVPAREAVEREIPIVLYGECPQNEYGAGPAGSDAQKQLTKAWVDEFGGMLGLRLADVAEILQLNPRNLELYRYPADRAEQVRAVWMGAYFDWDGYGNARTAREHGFSFFHREVEGTGAQYENLDNYQTGIHDRLRYLKFGFTRADDILSSAIRRGRMSREVAAAMAVHRHRHHGSYLGKSVTSILRDIGLTLSAYHDICERFTNREVVAWASQPASYAPSCMTSTDASKDEGSIPAVASAA